MIRAEKYFFPVNPPPRDIELRRGGATEFADHSVAPPLLSSISQGGFTGNFFPPALITAEAFSYIRTAFGASRSMRVGVRSAPAKEVPFLE